MENNQFNQQPEDMQRAPDFGRPEPMGPQSVDAQTEFEFSQPAPEAPEQPQYAPQQPPVQQTYQQPTPPPVPPYQQPAYGQYQQPAQPKQSKGLAVASMILGICSIVFFSTVFLSLICAIVGLVLGIIGAKKKQGAMAIAGIVTSVIGILIVVIVFVFAVAMVGEVMNEFLAYY